MSSSAEAAEYEAPPALLLFDVNKFLKKTFSSDYDFNRQQDGDDELNDETSSRSRSLRSMVVGVDDEGGGNNFCAYCGQEILSSSSSSNAERILYCSSCTNFFNRYSPSELGRRIGEYDQLLAAGDDPTNTTTTNQQQPKESAPLLSTTVFTHISSSDVDPASAAGDPPGYVGGVHRYARRNNDQHNRRSAANNNKLSGSFLLSPYYRHRQQNRQQSGDRILVVAGGGHTNSNTRTSSWDPNKWGSSSANSRFSEQRVGGPSSVVIWGGGGNNGNNSSSRRSSYTSSGGSSWSRPTCRICHLHGEPGETLVAPCRCAGTMQYVHTGCLVHWLEISAKNVLPSPQCELCGYHYRTHHCYKLQRMYTPSCTKRDRLLHVVFALMILLMLGCATLSAFYLHHHHDKQANNKRTSLNSDDIVVIASALLFFCAFFVAVFTQYRSDTSVCRLCFRFWLINKHWRVKDYDMNLDYERPGNQRGDECAKPPTTLIMEQI